MEELKDPLQKLMMGEMVEQEEEALAYQQSLNEASIYQPQRGKFEVLEVTSKEKRPTHHPKFELKPLPTLLNMIF